MPPSQKSRVSIANSRLSFQYKSESSESQDDRVVPSQRDLDHSTLIEKTRSLMERTIEFVPHERFDDLNAREQILSLRPESLDHPEPPQESRACVDYLHELVRTPQLTPAEEHFWFLWMNFLRFRAESQRRKLDLGHPDEDLIDTIESDLAVALKARNHIVEANLRLVVANARKMSRSPDQMSELISEGMKPLIRSVELFDLSLNNRFSTFATWAIRYQMFRWIQRLHRRREFPPSHDAFLLESVIDERSFGHDAEILTQRQKKVVKQLLSLLSRRERQIIAARYALDGESVQQTLAVIADREGVSKERVRQIALAALAKLRSLISDTDTETVLEAP